MISIWSATFSRQSLNFHDKDNQFKQVEIKIWFYISIAILQTLHTFSSFYWNTFRTGPILSNFEYVFYQDIFSHSLSLTQSPSLSSPTHSHYLSLLLPHSYSLSLTSHPFALSLLSTHILSHYTHTHTRSLLKFLI